MLLRATAAVSLFSVLLAGCASHEPRAAFRRGVLVDDRGISIPLPPPSLVDEPVQDVDIRGTAPGEDELVAGTRIHVEDLEGGAELSVELDVKTASFELRGLTIDVTANCLELWLESADGRESERTHVRTVVVDATTIETQPGCE